MGERLRVTPEHLRAGADTLEAEQNTVTGSAQHDVAAAISGLTGFATGAALASAYDVTVTARNVVAGRFARMAELCRTAADGFESAEMTTDV